jgi:hypothetical protein
MALKSPKAPAHPHERRPRCGLAPFHPQGVCFEKTAKTCHTQKQLAKMAGSGSIVTVS